MVSVKIVSQYKGVPPDGNGSRNIANGPIYAKDEVFAILSLGETAIVPWTRKCISDLKKYELDHIDVIRFIEVAITQGEYKGSEWCINGRASSWAACDSYRLFEKNWVPAAHKEMMFEYYVKFAIGVTGNVILTVSCHLSEERW